MTKSKIFIFSISSFIAGVAVRSFLAVYYPPLFIGIFIFLIFFVFGVLKKQIRLLVLGLCGLIFVMGIIRLDYVRINHTNLGPLYGRTLIMRGIITEEPKQTNMSERLIVRVTEVEKTIHEPFLVLISLRRYPHYQLGDELKILGVLKKPENFADFDYVSYLAKDEIYATMYFPEVDLIEKDKGNSVKLLLSKIKNSFEEKLTMLLPEPHAAFLAGLLLGERESLPEDILQDFRRTGTTHIVALSGYNITIIGRFFIAALLFATIPFRVSFWIASFAIALFVMLTGASPSVVRAGIMGILVLIAEREGRMYQITNALIFAAGLMVFQNPKILRFDTAFQLSFLATIGLIYLAPYLEARFSAFFHRSKIFNKPLPSSRISRFFSQAEKTLIETLSAQIMVLPLLIYLFGSVSLISPVVNILVLASIPYTMALGFLTGGIGFFSQMLAQILSFPAWILLEYQLRVIEFFAKIPGASFSLPWWTIFFIVPLYAVLFFKLKKTPKRRDI